MALLIQNGEVVTASARFLADIFCEGETITRIGPNLPVPAGAQLIDASGQYVFPGFIDPHVHIYLPCMGSEAKDSHASASRAALLGGTTTLIEMLGPSRQEDLLAGFELWLAKAQAQSACDFSFHMTVPRFDSKAEAQLREIVRRGISSFKVYLAYKDAFGLSDEELFKTLRLARELGVLTTAHCENADLIRGLQQDLLAQGKSGPEWHHASRPPFVEAEGVHHLLAFAEALDAPVYIVHLSCREALEQVKAAKARGQRVWAEALIQHLLLDKTYAERPDFEGAKYVMSPPLREASHQAALWQGLREGSLDTLASDHAPFDFATQKRFGLQDFTKIPNGLPGVQDRINLFYTYGVQRGQLSLQRLVETASTQAARLFGLFPRKGTIQEGSDADLVVYDPKYRGVISAKTHAMNVDYNAFEGVAIEGRPSLVTLRGQVVVREGQFVGQPGQGRFLARQPQPL